MLRAALRKAGPTVLGVTIASALGVYVDRRNRATIHDLQWRVKYYTAHEQMLEKARAMDQRNRWELQIEYDRLAEQAFYAYRELCRLHIDQEAARAFTASDTPGQIDEDDIVLLGPGNVHAARADANPDAFEAAQRRDKARMMIRMLDKPDYWSYAALGSHLRWLPRDSDSAVDGVVLREARADLLAAGLLKKEEEEEKETQSPAHPTQK